MKMPHFGGPLLAIFSLMESILDIEDLIKGFRLQVLPSEDSSAIESKRSKLLAWYRANRRKLPWRGDNTDVTPSPYGTWVSEIMLQQTRVETVIDYWKKWMVRFPTVQTLAEATPDEVNQYWAGLGYYRRAQQLLKGAQYVMNYCKGVIPSEVPELLKVPGIGPYTAGAIASIAFGKAEPLVDGNVIRVFSRLYAIGAEIGGAGGVMEKSCWKLAASLVDPDDPGSFNQSLMELGATVCKPTSPQCGSCPLSSMCAMRALVDHRLSNGSDQSLADLPSEVSMFPRKVAKKKPLEVSLAVGVLAAHCPEGGGKYLFSRRPATGLLANQWEFPCAVLSERESADATEGDGADEQEEGSQARPSEAQLWSALAAHLERSLNLRLRGCSSSSGDDVVDLSVVEMIEVPAPPGHCEVQQEPIVHIFSHQRHTMFVTIRHVDPAVLVEPVRSGAKWMTAEEITAEGITSGCKKILSEVVRCSRGGGGGAEAKTVGKRAAKRAPPGVKQEEAPRPAENEEKRVFSNAFEKLLFASNSATSKKKDEPIVKRQRVKVEPKQEVIELE